jgi:hypothetical protein
MGGRSFILISKIGAISIFLLALKIGVSHQQANPDSGLRGLERVEKIDWLVVGASHVTTGFDFDRLKAETGQSFYPLWSPGINPAEFEILLHEAMERHGHKICRVVVDLNSSLFSTLPQIREEKFFYDLPLDLKWRAFKLYLSYPRGPLDLAELLFSSRTSEIFFNALTGKVNSAPETHFKELSAEEWKELPNSVIHKGPVRPIFAEAIAKISRESSSRYPGKVWFTETSLPDFRYKDPRVLALKREVLRILEENGNPAYFDSGERGFPNEDYRYFGDQHHPSVLGREKNTEIFLRDIVRPEIEASKVRKAAGSTSSCD